MHDYESLSMIYARKPTKPLLPKQGYEDISYIPYAPEWGYILPIDLPAHHKQVLPVLQLKNLKPDYMNKPSPMANILRWLPAENTEHPDNYPNNNIDRES